MRRVGVGVVAVLLALATVSCSDGADEETAASTSAAPLTLGPVPLPDGVAPVAVASGGAEVLVGGRGPDGDPVRPRLWRSAAPGALTEVTVDPVSPTAYEARWFQLDVDPRGRVTAFAGAPAGAHANTRWSTWSGADDAVRELPQPFQTFGGLGAGSLNALVRTPDGPVIIGSWQGSIGLDIAVWRRSGDRWTRTPTTAGSALASTPEALVGARRATARGGGVLATGSVTELGQGVVTLRAAAWLTDGLDEPWRRVDLPTTTTPAEAHASVCDDDRCTVVGQAGGRLVAWTVADDGRAAPVPGVPDVPVGDKVQLVAPVVADDGRHLLVVADGPAGHVVSFAADGSVRERPYEAPGVPLSAAWASSGDLWVVHETPGGDESTLHTLRWD